MSNDRISVKDYLTNHPALSARDIKNIQKAIKNDRPIILTGFQMSGKTTLANVLRKLGATVYEEGYEDACFVEMKHQMYRSEMIPYLFDKIDIKELGEE